MLLKEGTISRTHKYDTSTRFRIEHLRFLEGCAKHYNKLYEWCSICNGIFFICFQIKKKNTHYDKTRAIDKERSVGKVGGCAKLKGD